jgi:hypothetical protein
MQAFPTGIQQPFIDWTTKKAKDIYNDLVKKNKLSDFDIAMLEGDKIARETEERARQMQEEANYYNQLPTHNSNGNTINYNSNGHRVASWEDEMAHWELVGEEAERNKMFNENMDSSYMRAEEKSAVEEEAKALKKAQAQQNADNTKAKKRTKHDLLRERVRNKRKADAEAKAIKDEANGVKMSPPPSASVAAPVSAPAPPPLPEGWTFQTSSRNPGTFYFFNDTTDERRFTLPRPYPEHWYLQQSSRTLRFYYFNSDTGENRYDLPPPTTGGRKRKTKTNKLGKGKGKTRKIAKSKKAQRKTRKSRIK